MQPWISCSAYCKHLQEDVRFDSTRKISLFLYYSENRSARFLRNVSNIFQPPVTHQKTSLLNYCVSNTSNRSFFVVLFFRTKSRMEINLHFWFNGCFLIIDCDLVLSDFVVIKYSEVSKFFYLPTDAQ